MLPVLRSHRFALLVSISVAGCALPHAKLRDAATTDITDAQPFDGDAEIDVEDVAIDSPIADDADANIDVADASDGSDVIDATMDARDVIDVADVATDARPDASDGGGDVPLDQPCPTGRTLCGTSCVDLTSDLMHCGRCNAFCPTSTGGIASCTSSTCGLVCNAGYRFGYDPGGTPTCTTDVTPAASSCPGQDIQIEADGTQTLIGTTEGRPAMRIGSGDCALLSGPEAIFKVTARAAGVLRVTLTAFESLGFYVIGGACGGPINGAQLDCAYDAPAATQRARTQGVSLEATAGQVFTVVVDSPLGAPQPFALTVSHQSDCGQLTATSSMSRTCGDGNTTASDGCGPTCGAEMGLVQSSCGASMSSTARVLIGNEPAVFESNWMGPGGMFSACGMGHDRAERVVAVDVPTPTSVRIDLKPGSGVRSALLVRRGMCTNATGELCGNNVDDTSVGERVDVTTTMPNERLYVIADTDGDAPFTLRFTPRNCGDGRFGPDEQCDDGNTRDGDGCDGMCRVEARCDLREGAADTTPTTPVALPSDCDSLRYAGRIDPTGPDRDDAVRLYLRAGQSAVFQLSSGGQGRCPRGIDPIIEVSRGTRAVMPMTRNNECVNNFAAICADDAITYCPDAQFVAPVDDWYTFRVFRYRDAGAAFDYELLFRRR